MSGFNKIRYNRSRYNVIGSQITYLKCSVAERVTSSVGTASVNYLTANVLENVAANVSLFRGYLLSASPKETITSTTNRWGYFFMRGECPEIITAETEHAVIAMMSSTAEETIAGDVSISQYATFVSSLNEIIESDSHISQDIRFLPVEIFEYIGASAELEANVEYICYLNLDIAPGQTLIIDAANYNVLLDGENYIHAQSGDWLDDLNRNTQKIELIGTGVRNLSATILYTERYL